jgi:hypothetical protein
MPRLALTSRPRRPVHPEYSPSERTTQITEQLSAISTREAEARAELSELVRALRIEETPSAD